MNKLLRLLFVMSLLAAVSSLSAATITISIVRTTMPGIQWDAFKQGLSSYEATVQSYSAAYGINYAIESAGDSVDFVYSFPGGWDYGFWNTWQNEVVAILNANTPASLGFRWEVAVNGAISAANNPWNEVNWLPDVTVYDGQYLSTPSLGFFYAPGWAPEGNFWAYAYDLAGVDWFWVVDGYYWIANTGLWCWNIPGSRYFWVFDGVNSGWTVIDPRG